MAVASKYDLFISYHSPDERWVADFARVLTHNRLSVFFAPEAIRAGAQTARELDKAIRDSAAAIVVVSTATADSMWVELEVGLLLHLLTRRLITSIIPVVRDYGARMPPMLDSMTRIQLPVSATPAEAARRVLSALRTGAPPNCHERAGPETAVDESPPVSLATPGLEAVSIRVDAATLEFLVLPLPRRNVALARTPFTEGHLAAIHSDLHVRATYAGSALPLTTISIEEMDEVCRQLRLKTGRYMRLPTSSEWVCAYRAGTTTRYFHGDAARLLRRYAHLGDAGPTLVGQHQPNAWGFFDMAGNVWEVCRDAARFTVGRGGSYASEAEQCNASFWVPIDSGMRSEQVGFRLCLAFDEEADT